METIVGVPKRILDCLVGRIVEGWRKGKCTEISYYDGLEEKNNLTKGLEMCV